MASKTTTTFEVTLRITQRGSDNDIPSGWNWPDLCAVDGDTETVELVRCKRIAKPKSQRFTKLVKKMKSEKAHAARNR